MRYGGHLSLRQMDARKKNGSGGGRCGTFRKEEASTAAGEAASRAPCVPLAQFWDWGGGSNLCLTYMYL